ncbi:MAG: hypothetical protein WDM71_00870 [Ferruginibacter sp.]
MELQQLIAEAWSTRELLKDKKYADAVHAVIEEVDKGRLRTAAPTENGWQVNEWVKQAILLYFGIQQMETFNCPPFEFYDKMKLKSGYASTGSSCSAACCCALWRLPRKKRSVDAKLCQHRCVCR